MRGKYPVLGWVRGAAIGRGSSGAVHVAYSRGCPPDVLAVKSAPLCASSFLRREESVLAELKDCPQIIPCFGHDITAGERGSEPIYNVFLEYAPGGSIADAIRRCGGALPVRRYLRSILLGLRHIHATGYVHCDIKPHNILIFAGDGGGEAKIADFGLAKRAGDGCGGEIRGTPMYMAPESVARKEYEPPGDIWALGCTTLEMITGRPPWRIPDNHPWGTLMRIGAGDEMPVIPSSMTEEGKDFLRRCFERNPSKRWTAEMLLAHPFLASSSEFEGKSVSFSGCTVSSPSPRSVLGSSFFSIPSFPSAADSVRDHFAVNEPRGRLLDLAAEERPDWACCSPETNGWISVRESSILVKLDDKISLPPSLPASRPAVENMKGYISKYCFVNLPCNNFFSTQTMELLG
ncbi:hypothetical protein HPP92_021184 [Vanilla planifolia]|uniref:Protein kinase domain-containing protein n=1 Tax=Vanilla planifolia TaxID=51239 RepID=A0A835Q535_VANPL|nr:hypothetical protein HPP92_021184 [Vanilla planifolia]